MASTTLVLVVLSQSAGHFNLSNTLGDSMVLQREPQQAVVWGFGDLGVSVTATFKGKELPAAKVDATGTWRISLPATPASKVPTTITFAGSDGGSAALREVLFGDVFLCSGQSNMQYTPHSMAGMNNLTAELAAADSYGDTVRFFTVGQDTHCGDPKKGGIDCTKPFAQLNTNIPGGNNISGTRPCRKGQSCRETWEPASFRSLGGNGSAWNTFSAVCWLTFRDVHDALGGDVPMGLISNNWGGTPVQVWMPLSATKECNPKATVGGTLYNSMVAPYTVGPMTLRGATWYQGESNVGQASFYSCGFPAMIKSWRELFKVPDLWFGFVQIANFRYSVPYGNPPRAEQSHSWAAGDLRQSQLAALALPNIGLTTAIDTGDWTNIHPPDKQTPSRRLANQALTAIYKKDIPGSAFPLFVGQKVTTNTVTQSAGGTVSVTVNIWCCGWSGKPGGKPCKLSTVAPLAATQSSTLGKGVSVPRNKCITAGFANTFPQDCGYPQIYGANASSMLNATATIGSDGSSIVLTAAAPAGFEPVATSYGRASWPRTVFYAGDLPVIPWYSDMAATNAWTPPKRGGWVADQQVPTVRGLDQME